MKKFLAFLLFMLALVCGQVATAQEAKAQAALVQVIYQPLQVQLGSATNALPLPVGAEAPLTAGDSIETNATGRALITFPDGFSLYLLPKTQFHLLKYALGNGGVIFAAHSNGQVIQISQTDIGWDSYHLDAAGIYIRQPARSFAAWSYPGQPTVVTVAEGDATLDISDAIYPLRAGEGLFWEGGSVPRVAPLDAPYHAARLEASFATCHAVAQPTEAQSLTIRAGADLGFSKIGFVVAGETLPILGVNQRGTRYRIQRFTGFGWVDKLGVMVDCLDADLPAYNNLFQETNVEMWGLLPEELAFLMPYFGTPKENRWFYRSLLPE